MKNQRGDTIVEVLIATAILAMAVVGGLGIMNLGFGVIMNSIERTQVQAQLNSQIALIQYARDTYVRADRQPTNGGAYIWNRILTTYARTAKNNNVCTTNGSPATSGSSPAFYINDNDATVSADPLPNAALSGTISAATGMPSPGQGIWVEAVRPAGQNFVDFYVKACWRPISGSVNQESRSVMRLYVP